MESIITLVGFLGAGKTTLLKHLVERALDEHWRPFVILNDYMDADIDAQQLSENLGSKSIKALTGSCICCDGIAELRSVSMAFRKEKQGSRSSKQTVPRMHPG